MSIPFGPHVITHTSHSTGAALGPSCAGAPSAEDIARLRQSHEDNLWAILTGPRLAIRTMRNAAEELRHSANPTYRTGARAILKVLDEAGTL